METRHTIPFWKYHALGNDYVVVDGRDGLRWEPDMMRRLCHRHYGLGADGVLMHLDGREGAGIGLQIVNPDGSEAEKSGNGLRIFARYLWDRGLVKTVPFQVWTRGGTVMCKVQDEGAVVTVDMGSVSFHSRDIPVAGTNRDVLNERINVADETFTFSAATVGNPHCAVLCEHPSEAQAR